jgi:hypothetical protein
VLIGDTLVGLPVSPTRRRNDAWKMVFNRSSSCAVCEGHVYPAANEFLCHLEALRQEILSQCELRKNTQGRTSESSFRPISSFHTDPRYVGDLHRADMAWAVHAAGHGLSREQIENEILRARDLSKKGSSPRQFDYAARTARKATSLSTA